SGATTSSATWSGASAASSAGAASSGVSSFTFSSVSSIRSSLPTNFGLHVESALTRHGERARKVLLGLPHPRGVLELAGRVLEAEVEHLLARVVRELHELRILKVMHLDSLHCWPDPSRITNLVFTGSLWPARRIASRASGSGTPDSSNITRPGFTTATQPSGVPLPEPMRVSAGFFVYGLSGKMLIQTFPPRLILRVIAIRAASIWRLVTQPRSSAFSP